MQVQRFAKVRQVSANKSFHCDCSYVFMNLFVVHESRVNSWNQHSYTEFLPGQGDPAAI